MFRRVMKITVVATLLVTTFGTGVEGSVVRPNEAPIFTKVAGGLIHTCAITTTKVLYCWGGNWYGQLGTGDSNPVEGKHLVQGDLAGKEVVDISLGQGHTCALTSEGIVYCWGDGGPWVGSGTTDMLYEPHAVIGGSLNGTFVTNVDAGNWNTCANTYSGFSCWGENSFYQINLTNVFDNALYPAIMNQGVFSRGEVTDFSVGENLICAVVIAKVACSGDDLKDTLQPEFVRGGYLRSMQVTSVAAGTHTCAITTLGTVACWGHNTRGQLGDGTVEDRVMPRRVNTGALTNVLVEQIEASEEGTCAVTTRGKLACWGINTDGQVGNGSIDTQPIPTLVNTGALRGKAVISVGMGELHTCAITQAGRIACWGDNAYGQLGDGTTNDSRRPKFIAWE